MIAKPTVQSGKVIAFVFLMAILMLPNIAGSVFVSGQSAHTSHNSGLNQATFNVTPADIAQNNSPIREIALQNDSQPLGITLDSRDNVWFAENNPGSIVEYNPASQKFNTYSIPMKGTSMIWSMFFDNSGNLWFANQVQPYLWRFSPSTGHFANFTTGNQLVRPFGLAYDPSNQKIWFTSTYTDQIGYFDISGENAILGKLINSTGTPKLPYPPLYGPTGIQIGPQGNIFVSEPFSGNIVEYNPSQQKFINVWRLPNGSQPVGIAIDNTTGKIWFANHASSLFGNVDEKTGKVIEFATSPFEFYGDTISLPYWTKLTPNGTVWFDEHASNKIARYVPSTGALTEFAVPTNRSAPLHFVLDNQRGVVWFTEFIGSKLSEINENATCGCSVQLSETSLTLSSAPISFYLRYQLEGNQSLSSDSPKPLLTGTFELDGFVTNNLTESYSVVNSSYYEITLSKGQDLTTGKYTITVCPRFSNSDNITSPAPIRECATASLEVVSSDFNLVAAALAVAAVAATLLLSLVYVRRWRPSGKG